MDFCCYREWDRRRVTAASVKWRRYAVFALHDHQTCTVGTGWCNRRPKLTRINYVSAQPVYGVRIRLQFKLWNKNAAVRLCGSKWLSGLTFKVPRRAYWHLFSRLNSPTSALPIPQPKDHKVCLIQVYAKEEDGKKSCCTIQCQWPISC